MPTDTATVLERLTALHPKIIDLTLARIEGLLSDLGHPELSLPPVVHVAGTNGKGSTLAFLRAYLEAAGYKVHVYTSPHLVRFNERIRLAGEIVSTEYLIDLLEECETVNAGKPITFFEITTAAAFLAMARVRADIILLETGLGGRLDATNVLAQPQLTVITPVSIDHIQYLGAGITNIAAEKAGILKPGITGVIAPQPHEAQAVIEARAQKVGAPLYQYDQQWVVDPVEDPVPSGALTFRGEMLSLDLPSPGLAGPHQHINAGTAVACLENLPDFDVGEAAIRRGLATVEWPGRLQRLAHGGLTDILPRGWELWIDGGHNPAAGDILARAAMTWHDRPLHVVFGMLNTKDPAGFLNPMAPHIRSLTAIPIPDEQASFSAEEAAAAAKIDSPTPRVADDLDGALALILRDGGETGRILVCGSLYLVGAALKRNGEAT